MTKEQDKIIEEIRKELENGITRNKVLPIDWAIDRIEPIIEKALQSQKEKLKEDIEKSELKILNDINWDLTELVNNLRDDLKLDTQHKEKGYKNKEHSYNAIKRFTEKVVYRICNKWKLKRKELLKSIGEQKQ